MGACLKILGVCSLLTLVCPSKNRTPSAPSVRFVIPNAYFVSLFCSSVRYQQVYFGCRRVIVVYVVFHCACRPILSFNSSWYETFLFHLIQVCTFFTALNRHFYPSSSSAPCVPADSPSDVRYKLCCHKRQMLDSEYKN